MTDSGVYVIITSSGRLDYHPNARKEGEWHVIFELGWERSALSWTENESEEFVRVGLAHALARPLNQWSFKQAEGTARAARRMLPADAAMAREIAALHLVFQLRQADFGNIYGYLHDVDGFPYDTLMAERERRDEKLVNWIVDKLFELGWSRDRVAKELVEWLWLKTNTWPQWLLAVASANVLVGNQAASIAVRHWVAQGLDFALDVVPRRHDRDEMAATYRALLVHAQLGEESRSLISGKMVAKLATGSVGCVEFFARALEPIFELDSLDDMLLRAQNIAALAGDYGIAVGLAQKRGVKPPREWIDIVKVRKLSTKLS
jgi:hypothetical protein